LPSFFQKACAVKARSLVALRRERNIPNEPFFLLLFLWALLLPKEKVIVPIGTRQAAGNTLLRIGDRFIWAFHVEGR